MRRETRGALAIIVGFVVLIGAMVGYNAYATKRERPTALVVDVTARQRTLTERYVKDTILLLDGVQADPDASAKILRETATALLDGGLVVTPQGSLDQRVRVPAATNAAVREKLRHERILIDRMLATGTRLRAEGKASPTFAHDLEHLRVQGAELSSVTGDAAGEITKAGQAHLSHLVDVEIVLGLVSAVAAVGMGLLLRRGARRQSDRFRALVGNAFDMITVLDDQAVAIYQSPSCERVLGYTPSEIEGTRLTDLLHPSDKKRAIESFVAAYDRPGETVPVQFTVRHRDGRWLLLEGTATNLLADKRVRGFVLNSRDVTDRERAAAELAAARDAALSASVAKSQFLASMSHEIRTPMNAIIGLTDLLLDTPLETEQREFAKGVKGAADGLLGIINDILDFSKVEAGKVEIEAVPIDLDDIVGDVASMLGEIANAKGVELLAHRQSDVPTALVGDPTRLRQILLNLTSNAVKFTEHGEVVIRVRLVEHRPDEVVLRFEVQDTGVGIAAKDLGHLFDPFSQADASTTRRFGGTGLGLAIAKQFIELMHGEVGVESTVDVGSTFWFALALPRQHGTSRARVAVPELAGLRALIVDDNATNRLILREQLGSWGVHTADADGARRALDTLRDAAAAGEPYDIVVLDLNMPEMDGLDLAQAINTDPAIAGPRLFLLSSSGRVGRDVARAAGLAGSLTKPARQSELFNCLIGGLATADPDDDAIPAPDEPAAPRRRGRILLVEDNTMNQLVATKVLTKHGFEVDVARNGIEALAVLDQVRFDAVLMDCQMPEMDGYAATRAIRSREGSARHTPIIAMTAAAMDGDRELCLEAGMDDYITKPIRPATVLDALDRWIDQDRAHIRAAAVADATPAAPAVGSPPGDPDVGAELDPERLALLRDLDDGDGTLLATLAEEFVAEARRQLDTLRAGVAEGDPQVVERAAHSIKGSSSNLGAAHLSDIAAHLEGLGRARALERADDTLAELEAEFDRVRVALAALESVG